MVPGLIEPHASPRGTLSEKAIVPPKPYNEATVIVAVADWPTLTAAGEVAEIVKFGVGGPRGAKACSHSHPMGLPLYCTAPKVPAPGVLVQLPANPKTPFILSTSLPSYRCVSVSSNSH